MRSSRASLLSAIVLWALGCGSSGDSAPAEHDAAMGDESVSQDGGDTPDRASTPEEASVTIDEASVMAMAGSYASLEKINRVSFASRAGQTPHAGDPMVDVYVNSVGSTALRGIDPSMTVTADPFPGGTLIVKYNQGSPSFLTVMYKAPAGYDSAHSDWWYGRLNVDGSSTGYTGRVDFCISCHGVRALQNYVYGVPLDDR